MALLTSIADELAREVDRLEFGPPVVHVYNPLVYARAAHHAYLNLAGDQPGRVVLLGMNPGPWGMTQTGVPFGEVAYARDWLGIDAPVEPPAIQHPKRPILGFDCRRSEVSGRRVWGWAKRRFGSPGAFFERFLVWNYCPLAFLLESGANLTPDRLAAPEKTPLFEACDRALLRAAQVLEPQLVVGVGAFAEGRAQRALAAADVPIGRMLHPSPASPAANRGWEAQAERDLRALSVDL
ncbi:MAG: single-stranded DNA-binding protein [Acidobacteriota bacterium]|nr:single-stranded DNA-binding protein [Acidobacteriota bacterium]